MNTPSPIRIQFEPRRRAGLTILEMLVSTAMLSFIVLGLTAMLIQTQKAFRTGIKENTITDAGRSIMDMISGDLRQMSDAQNNFSNAYYLSSPWYFTYNFFWGLPAYTPPVFPVTNYLNGFAVRTNFLYEIFILQHTNANWVGVGYAVSNYSCVAGKIGMGALYRYEANWTSVAPVFTNDLFSQFYYGAFVGSSFPTNYWHLIADGVIDLKILAYDQFGNIINPPWQDASLNRYAYPIYNPNLIFQQTNMCNTNLPNAVEVEFGILEPDALAQARVLAGIPTSTALLNFLSSNALPKMEIFRQRITIAAASR